MTTDSERLYCIDKRDVTLNGKTATVSGRLNRFATVATLDGQQSFEWSWDAAYMICATKEGRFTS